MLVGHWCNVFIIIILSYNLSHLFQTGNEGPFSVIFFIGLMLGYYASAYEEFALGELHLSAISEAMNQMMGSAATSLSSMLNKMIDISPNIFLKFRIPEKCWSKSKFMNNRLENVEILPYETNFIFKDIWTN